MTASYADANHERLSQRTPIARAGQARANVPATPVRGIIDDPAMAYLQNNERRPRRCRPTQLRAAPRSTNLAATAALNSP